MPYESYTKEVLAKYRTGLEVYQDYLDRMISEGDTLLHLGCGRDINGLAGRYRGQCSLYGVDPDGISISKYPSIAWCADGARLPFGDNVFDVVFSEYVLEHLSEPERVFTEVSRILSKDGVFISLAPNFFSYKSLAAHITPLKLHKLAVRFLRAESPRLDSDVYPTLYRANTLADLQRLAMGSGFVIDEIQYIDNGPTWFRRIPGLFELGRLAHAFFRFSIFSRLRCNILVVLRKSGGYGKRSMVIRCTECGSEPMKLLNFNYVCDKCNAKYTVMTSYWVVGEA